jgi:hypothetical protein
MNMRKKAGVSGRLEEGGTEQVVGQDFPVTKSIGVPSRLNRQRHPIPWLAD